MKSIETLKYHAAEDLEFSLSSHGHIDSSKYSLLETLYDPRLANLGIQQRLDVFNSYLHDLDAKDHYLYRRELASACLPVTDIMDFCDGQKRPMINLASNDYLNLSQHPRVKEAAIEAIAQYGVGSGSASMLAGTTSLHVQLEQRVAQFKGTEAAMLNSSGYALNIGTLKALLGPNDAAICDMYAHASMLDGCTHAKRYFFKHNDPISLEQTLRKAHLHANKIVVLDGVYSMDGDIAKLDEIVEIAHRHGAYVLVDEAHADGVIGPNGSGTMAHHGIVGKVDIVTGVFSKGLGGVGGYAAGNLDLIRYLHAAARSYMFATSMAMPTVASAMAALDILDAEPQLIAKLQANIQYFRSGVQQMGFDVAQSETAIIPLIIGNDEKVKEMALRLQNKGVFVNAVPYPAVPKRLTRIRASLSSGLSTAQLDQALEAIAEVGRELDLVQPKYLEKIA